METSAEPAPSRAQIVTLTWTQRSTSRQALTLCGRPKNCAARQRVTTRGGINVARIARVHRWIAVSSVSRRRADR